MKSKRKKPTLELISCSEILRQTKSQNIVIKFSPHQTDTLIENPKINTPNLPKERNEIIKCSCTRGDEDISTKWSKFLSDTFKKDKTSTLWINPSCLPTSCLLSCLFQWKKFSETKQTPVQLGLFIPGKIHMRTEKNTFEVFDIKGNVIDKNNLENIIWYVSLARGSNELSSNIRGLDLRDIFPLTEVNCEAGIGSYRGMTRHKNFLNKNKVRTEKIMYINPNTPNETFDYLLNSILHLPTKPLLTTPVVTPGGEPINYLSMILSAIASESYIFIKPNETYSKNFIDSCFILNSGA